MYALHTSLPPQQTTMMSEHSQAQAGIALAEQTEREQLIRDVKDELRTQELKREILAALRSNSWSDRAADLLKHPAFFIFVSFALTGLIGGWLEQRWHSREWNRQQWAQIRLHRIEEAYAIRDAVIKAVATHNAAIRSVPRALDYEPTMSKPSRDKLAQYLRDDRREWDAESEVLRQKLNIYFADFPEIIRDYDAFIQRRRITTYPQIEASVYFGLKEPNSAAQWNDHTYKLLDEEWTSLQQLLVLMTRATEELYTRALE